MINRYEEFDPYITDVWVIVDEVDVSWNVGVLVGDVVVATCVDVC